jgi:hypothetical protein
VINLNLEVSVNSNLENMKQYIVDFVDEYEKCNNDIPIEIIFKILYDFCKFNQSRGLG